MKRTSLNQSSSAAMDSKVWIVVITIFQSIALSRKLIGLFGRNLVLNILSTTLVLVFFRMAI